MKSEWAAGGLGKTSRKEPGVVFGRVHEDIESEMLAAAAAPQRGRAFAIASGGCAAFSLLALGFDRVDAVDLNPAQIRLINLKRVLLARLSRTEVLSAFTSDARKLAIPDPADLDGETRVFWRKHAPRCRRGLLFSGKAESALGWLVPLFHLGVCSRRNVARLLHLADLQRQEEEWQRSIDTWRWRSALRMMFQSGLLRLAYGDSILSRLPANPAAEIDQQFRDAITRTTARENSPLWLTFAGCFPVGNDGALPRYLRPLEFERVQSRLNSLTATCADASSFLLEQPPRSYDALMLSNILDLAGSSEARELSSAVIHAAKPGAVIVTRAIFPSSAPRLEGAELQEDQSLTGKLRAGDRSLICRHLTVYRRV